MVLKLAAIAVLVGAGLWLAPPAAQAAVAAPRPEHSQGLLTAMGAALVPVLFAYGGWQTACFVAAEVREPRRNLPRGLLLGVGGVIALYLAVAWVCLRVLGPEGLAATSTPAADVMRAALGERGAQLIAAGIAISTLGFLSQSMLTAPRVYYAMAADGSFLRSAAWVHPRSRVPVVAIALQGAVAAVIAWSGSYEQILSYVVAVDWIFFGLAGAALFVLRRHDRATGEPTPAYTAPGHPWTTAAFVAVSVFVVVNTAREFPLNSAIGIGILASGVPAWLLWRLWSARQRAQR
jgi:APA family basic amino acid/polyamine antiporter